jgi:hypothetical protein
MPQWFLVIIESDNPRKPKPNRLRSTATQTKGNRRDSLQVLVDTFVRWIRPRASASVPLQGHSVQKTAKSEQELFDQLTALYRRWAANQSWLMFGFPVQLIIGIGVINEQRTNRAEEL